MKNAIRSSTPCALNALVLTLAIAGCSKPAPVDSGPLVNAPAQSGEGQTVRASLTSNNIQSKYIARVRSGHIVSIEETRAAADGREAQGTYSFYEARLISYAGDAILGEGHEEAEFDLHGAIKRSQAENGPVGTQEMAAIRNRAELLRSHALARQAVQAHEIR